MLDRNLDAYRIVAEILAVLRNTVQRRLSKRHGEDWYRTALPEDVLSRLIERKEKEKTIDWYDSEYQQLIDFATFTELLDVLTANPDLVPGISRLAPNLPLLHARLLELDVLREKLALARPISENELSFLGTFFVRFRKAMREEESDDGADATGRSETAPDEDGGAEEAPSTEEGAEEDADRRPPAAAKRPQPVRPVAPPPEVAAPEVDEDDAASEPAGGETEPPDAAASRADAAAALKTAIEASDTTAILRALYREVIDIAEGLWTSEVPPEPEVWNEVRGEDWYARSFSSLHLQPLSDFYQVVEEVRGMMDEGLARDEVQELLKERNFAAILLSLRDMFQRHEI